MKEPNALHFRSSKQLGSHFHNNKFEFFPREGLWFESAKFMLSESKLIARPLKTVFSSFYP